MEILKHLLSTFHFCISVKNCMVILISNFFLTQTCCRLQSVGVEVACLAGMGKWFIDRDMTLTIWISSLMTSWEWIRLSCVTRSLSFSAFGCFNILKKDLGVYNSDRECFRWGKCCCGSYAVYFLDLKALKYTRSEFELLSEDISYHKQQPVGWNSDLLREYGMYVKNISVFYPLYSNSCCYWCEKCGGRQVTY